MVALEGAAPSQFRFNVRRHSDAPKQNEHRLKEQTRVQALRVKEKVRIGERSENDGNETAHLVDARQIIRVEFAAHIAKQNEHDQTEGLDVQHIRVLKGGYGLQQQARLKRCHLTTTKVFLRTTPGQYWCRSLGCLIHCTENALKTV